MHISVIVPVLNESASIQCTLARIRQQPGDPEIIVVDGGSADDTFALAAPLADRVLSAPRGRASQMNAGAAAASGDILLFLHADTTLAMDALADIAAGLSTGRHCWGRFDVSIEGKPKLLPVVARLMNLRSRLTGIATGDQGIFVTREAFAAVGGFPDQPLMEDIELSFRLKKLSAPLCLRTKAVTSGRRWETGGVWRTILLMWSLRLRYWLGASPDILARAYR